MLRPHIPINTARLSLRPFTLEDADMVYTWHQDPAVMQYTGGLRSHDQSLFDLVRWVRRFTTKGWGPLAVIVQETIEPIGWCGLQPLPHTCDFELFYGYAQSVWGQGYATEAGTALLRTGFIALPVDRIVARVHPDNPRSQRVVTKLGMRRAQPVYSDIYGGKIDLFVMERASQPPDLQ